MADEIKIRAKKISQIENVNFPIYENGDKFCNILDDEKEDCITVSDGILNVIMEEYPKIYIKQ